MLTFQSINAHVEGFFYFLGKKIAQAPRLIFAICLVFVFGSSFFMFLSKDETEITKLWIDPDSRWFMEDAFKKKYFSATSSRSLFLLVKKKKSQPGQQNVLTSDMLSEVFQITTNLYDFQITNISYNGVEYGYLDLCKRPPLPKNMKQFQSLIDNMGGIPCTVITPLTCFKEGKLTVPQALHGSGMFKDVFTPLISFKNRTSAELFARVEEGCDIWAGVDVPLFFLFGGIEKSNDDKITSIAGMSTIIDLSAPYQFSMKKKRQGQQLSEKESEKIMLAFEKEFLDQMKKAQTESKQLDIAYYSMGRSTMDLVEEASSANAALIAGGYISMLVFSAFTQIRRPRSSKYDTSAIIVGVVGVLLVVFCVGTTMGFIAIFGIAYTPSIKQVLPFLALGLGVDDMFVLSSNFIYNSRKTVPEMCASCLVVAGASISLTSLVNCIAFAIGASVPLPAVSSLSLAACLAVIINYFVILFGFTSVLVIWAQRLKKKEDTTTIQVGSLQGLKPKDNTRANVINVTENKNTCSILTNPTCMGIQFLVSVIIFGIAIYGATLVELGLPLQDIVPSDSYSSPFLMQRFTYYTNYPCQLVCGMSSNGKVKSLDYPNQMAELIDLELAISENTRFDVHDIQSSWLHKLIYYTNERHPDWVDDRPLKRHKGSFLIKPSRFNEVLGIYMNTISGAIYGESLYFNSDGTILTSITRVTPTNLRKTQDFLDWMEDTRAIVAASNLPCFMTGWVFQNYEQYIHVNEYLINDLIYVAVAIFFASFFFLYHPLAVIIMLVSIAKAIFEIYGFLHFFGLKINGVCVVNLIVASGVIIEFTAHLTRAFMVAEGTNTERVQKSLNEMGAPILMGGISTFLGVAWTGLSTFPYFRIYYFYNFFLIIFLGLFNAFFFLLPMLCISSLPSLTLKNVDSNNEETIKMTSKDPDL